MSKEQAGVGPSARRDEGSRGPVPSHLSRSFVLVAALWLTLLVVDRSVRWTAAATFISTVIGLGLVALLAAALAVGVWKCRRFVFREMTSLSFSVALLTVLLVSTVLGTLILQGSSADEFGRTYGTAVAPVLAWLGLDDLFHTIWFGGLLILLVLSLVLVPIRNRAWRPPMWGHLLAHLGIVSVLLGGFAGYLWGYKGNMDLHEGQMANEAVSFNQETKTAQRHSLGFSVRLEDFEIEHYESEYRIHVYQREGKDYRRLKSVDLDAAKTWTAVGPTGTAVRVVAVYRDFHLRTDLLPAPPGKGTAALELRANSSAEARRIVLLAGVAGRDAADLAPGGPRIRFRWDPPSEAEQAQFAQTEPERHRIEVRKDSCCPPKTFTVKLGESYNVAAGDHRLKVVKYLPDFTYDISQRRPFSRSDHPNNPAIQVAVTNKKTGTERKQWLFANRPDYGAVHGKSANGLRLVYHYRPPRRPAARELLVIGRSRDVWECAKGRVVRRTALGTDPVTLPGLPAWGARIFPSVEEVSVPISRSDDWNNPVVDLEIRHDGTVRSARLPAAHARPLRLPDGKTVLALEGKADNVRAFRSRLSVWADGQQVTEKTIAVNDPLYYGGYRFYQSNYRREDPSYSGILVVKDPGLPFVWAGFVMMCVGMVLVYYVRPRLLRRTANGT